MDIGSILNFTIGAVVALALGWIGWQEWQKASKEQKMAMVERVVLAVEQMYPDALGSDKLSLVLGRLQEMTRWSDIQELREMVEATVAKINLAKQGNGAPMGRGHWYE